MNLSPKSISNEPLFWSCSSALIRHVSATKDPLMPGLDDVATIVSEQSTSSRDIAQSMESLADSTKSTVNQMDIATTIATELEHVS